MKQDPSEALTITQFAQLMKVHVNTVRNGIKSGKIQAFKTGTGSRSHYRIYRFQLERMSIFDSREMIENIVQNKLKLILEHENENNSVTS